MSFLTYLRLSKGSLCKARRRYMASRGWRGDEWYAAWERGLADEVASAVIIYNELKET